MISKQGLWFLTLISLVLVLSVYYVTMPSELLLTNNQNYLGDSNEDGDVTGSVEIVESTYLMALRAASMDKRLLDMKDLQMVLTDIESSIDEKNNAYEQIKYLNVVKGQEEKLESKIKSEIKKDVFIKVENNHVKVVVSNKDHNYTLANNIMRSIQEEFDSKMYVSVKFQA